MPHASRFTVKEYLALEAVAETKHEFFDGYIVAMAGAELAHNQVAENVRAELRNGLGDRPCHIVGSDQRVLVEAVGEYFYPATKPSRWVSPDTASDINDHDTPD